MVGKSKPVRRLIITGVCGNLGEKLLLHFSQFTSLEKVVGLDIEAALKNKRFPAPSKMQGQTPEVEFIACDLTKADDARWREALQRADGLIHLAADYPFPDATWTQASASFDMTANLGLALAQKRTPTRAIFASSNHVMGEYKDSPLRNSLDLGGLKTDLPPGVGSKWRTEIKKTDSTPYATAKIMGERLFVQSANGSSGLVKAVNIRIGWCNVGENRPAKITASGSPEHQHTGQPKNRIPEEEKRSDTSWFHGMWLSNRDLCHLFERALFADETAWPGPAITINGISKNTGAYWSLEEARAYVQYEPIDDICRELNIPHV